MPIISIGVIYISINIVRASVMLKIGICFGGIIKRASGDITRTKLWYVVGRVMWATTSIRVKIITAKPSVRYTLWIVITASDWYAIQIIIITNVWDKARSSISNSVRWDRSYIIVYIRVWRDRLNASLYVADSIAIGTSVWYIVKITISRYS